MELPRGSLYGSFVSTTKKEGRFTPWEELIPQYIYDPTVPFHEIVVPTSSTVRYSYVLKS